MRISGTVKPIVRRSYTQHATSNHNLRTLIVSQSDDPHINLAYEHYLFQTASLPSMFLYRNRSAVVIGRNQNPWLEANIQYLQENNIDLVRRYSGGGAVYHDLGNTNYSYMMPRDKFDRDTTAQRIIAGLQQAGLDVRLNARHDITVKIGDEYKKCSGSAYKISKDRAYAHGTMLLRSDLDSLGPALRPKDHGIVGNGVESVRSRVANLNLSHESFCDIIAGAFTTEIQEISEGEMLSVSEVVESQTQLCSEQWTYSQTPVFTQTIATKDNKIVATIKQGRYTEIHGPKDLERSLQQLLGTPFVPEQLEALNQ